MKISFSWCEYLLPKASCGLFLLCPQPLTPYHILLLIFSKHQFAHPLFENLQGLSCIAAVSYLCKNLHCLKWVQLGFLYHCVTPNVLVALTISYVLGAPTIS